MGGQELLYRGDYSEVVLQSINPDFRGEHLR
jgi:hypothetical protein